MTPSRKKKLASQIATCSPWTHVGRVLDELNGYRSAITAKPRTSPFQEALSQLQRLAKEENIPIAIVGGAATIHHGYERFTKDIDIVVSTQDFERIIRVAYKYGFTIVSHNPNSFHELAYKGVPIEVIQEGAWGHENEVGAAPSPTQLGVETGLGFASLLGWVKMKLSASRKKDEADIVEVLKKLPPNQIGEIADQLANYDDYYHQWFQELWQQANDEKAGNRRQAAPWIRKGDTIQVRFDDAHPQINGKIGIVTTDPQPNPPNWCEVEIEGKRYPVRGAELKKVKSGIQ